MITPVDVIVPFYNTRIEYTRAALESIVAQTYPHWKGYVVNDGSSEASTRELEALLAEINDARFVYLRQENRGLPGARNTGIRASDSPYIAILDSDDWWHPAKLARQLPVLESKPSIGVVCASTDNLYKDKLTRYQPGGSDGSLVDLTPQDLFLRMLDRNVIAGNTVVFRRSEAERVGLYDEAFDSMEDKEFWMRLMLYGCRFHYMDESLGVYRVHPASLSRNMEKMRRGRIRLITKLDEMIRFAPREWARIDWPRHRAHMIRHSYQEASEEALEQGDYAKAIAYSLPRTGGVSAKTGLLIARSLYRMSRSAVRGRG